jgi:hypothetical protein
MDPGGHAVLDGVRPNWTPLILLLAAAFGAICAVMLLVALYSVPWGKWKPFLDASAQVEKVLVFDKADVYLKTREGTIIVCATWSSPSVCEPVFEAPPAQPRPEFCGPPSTRTPLSRGRVVSQLARRWCGHDGHLDEYIAVLVDGSVIRYTKGSTSYELQVLVFWGSLGGGLVGLVGAIVFLRRRRRKKRPTMETDGA